MAASEAIFPARSLSEVSEDGTLRFSVDLVAASRRNLGFLRLVSESQWLHQKATIFEAIRRYDQIWMPLIADLTTGTKPPMILPPLDVEWVWYCHTLNPANYGRYCESRFSKLIGKPTIFDDENEEYALNRCREIWEYKFPSEPFENEADTNLEYNSSASYEELFDQVVKHRDLYGRFSEPYYYEMVYLVAAKQRCFPNVADSSDSSFLRAQNSTRLGGSPLANNYMYSSPDGGMGASRLWFTLQELSAATDGFSRNNVLSEGGFGCVYKGVLVDGREVAVKQLKVGSGQGEREFRAEVEIVSRIHHRHLVSLVGLCISDQQRLLVYDFVANDTLHHHLHDSKTVMDWANRVKVAAGSARGLAYLHEYCVV